MFDRQAARLTDVLNENLQGFGQIDYSGSVVQIEFILDTAQGDRTIHGAGIQEPKSQLPCQASGDSAFPGPSRSVDGNYHVLPINQ